MKQILKPLAVASAALFILLPSCKKTGDHGGGNTSNANTIKGTIYDAKGNKFKIDNANVLVHVTGQGGGSNSTYHISMDDNSHYEQAVKPGLYTFDPRAIMSLNGKVVNIRLDPVDGNVLNTQFNSASGVTRDFRLKLTGLIPGGDPNDANSYYGAKIAVRDGAANYGPNGTTNSLAAKYPGSTVVFTLTPKADCIDGSHATRVEINVGVENLLGTGTTLVNFPLARYYLSMLLRKPGGQQYPLRVNFVSAATGPTYDFVDLSFSPALNDPDCWPGIPSVAVWQD